MKTRRPVAYRVALAMLWVLFAGAMASAHAEILVSSWEGRIARFDEVTGASLGDLLLSSPLSSNENVEYGPDGKLYVAEYSVNRVRRFFPDGTLDPSFSCAVPQASFLTFDATGNVYVSGGSTPALSVCDPNVVGQGNSVIGHPYVSGGGQPRLGPDGYIYYANYGTNQVTRFRPDGSDPGVVVTLDAGPVSLDFAPNGDLYVSVYASSTIYRWNAAQGLSTFAAVTAPYGIRFDRAGNLLVGTGDYQHYFYRIRPDGTYDTILTNLGVAPWVTVTPIPANLFVSFYFSNNVAEITSAGQLVRQVVPSGSGGLSQTSNLRFGPDGHLYVAATGTGSVKKYDGSTGAYVGDVIALGAASGVTDMIFDAAGNVYVAESGVERVSQYTSAGTFVRSYTERLSGPYGLAWHANGSLLVTNFARTYANTVTAIDVNTGAGTEFGTGVGSGPVGIAAGPDGRYYVASYGQRTVQVIPANGGAAEAFASTPAPGNLGFLTFSDGRLYAAAFDQTVTVYDAVTGAHLGNLDLASGIGVGIQGVAVRSTGDGGLPDSTPPALTLPASASAEATSSGGAAVTYSATAVDGVDGPRPVVCTPASGATFPVGTTTVNCSATDTQGNTATGSFAVTVRDTTTPALTLPADMTVPATGASGATVTYVASASDAVDGAVGVECTPTSGSTFPVGTTTVSCSATDAHANRVSGDFSVTVTASPAEHLFVSFYFSNSVAEITASGQYVGAFVPGASGGLNNLRFGPDGHLYVAATATGAVKKYDGTTGAYLGDVVTLGAVSGVTDVILDSAGNIYVAESAVERVSKYTAAGVFVRSYTDRLSGPYGLAWHANGNLLVTNFARTYANSVTAINVNSGTGTAFATGLATGPVGIAAGPDGRYYVASYYASAVQAIPSGGGVPTTFVPSGALAGFNFITFSADRLYVVAQVTGSVGVYDASTGAYLSTIPVSGFGNGVEGVAVRSAGGGGGPTDTTPPVLTLPTSMTAEATSGAGAVVTFTATAVDGVDGAVPVTCTPSGATFGLGATMVTCSASDADGNTATGSFTVTVRDTTAPAVTVPGSLTVEATSGAGAPVSYTASALDLVDGLVAVSCTAASGATFGLGTTTVSCTASDGSGNATGGSFTVTVQDTTAPALVLPGAMTVEATSAAGAAVSYSATATDLVEGAVPAVCDPASGSGFIVGMTTVSCTATDARGNTAGGSFTVTVTPALAHLFVSFYYSNNVAEITASGQLVSQLVVSGSGELSQTSNLRFGPDGHLYVAATGTGAIEKYDGTTGAHLGTMIALGAQSGVTDVIFDAAGNVYVAESGVERVSQYTSAGTFVRSYTERLSGPYGLAWHANGSLLVTNFARTYANTVTAIDVNTGAGTEFGTGVGSGPVGIAAGPDGRYYVASYGQRTVQVIPANGGAAEAFASTPAPGNLGFLTFSDGRLYAAAFDQTVTVYDAVTGAHLGNLDLASGIGMGIQGVAVRSTGDSGGPTDTTAPVLTLPTAATMEATSGAGATVTFTATAADAIDGPRPVTCTPGSGSVFPVGATTVSCSASDTHANTATGTFTVTIQDTTVPTLAGVPADLTVEATSAAGAVGTFATPTATDLVDGAVTVNCAPGSGSTFASGATTVICAATDAHGNTATGTFTVTVQDTNPPAAPTITSGPESPTKQTSATFVFSDTETSATFSCDLDGGGFSACASPQSYAGLAAGSHVFSVKAVDTSGNASGAVSFSWTVDLTAPNTVLDSMPLDPSSSATATFTFHATEAGGGFECSLDGDAFTACASPATYSGLSDGNHTFQVRAVDTAGNADATSAAFGWTIDTLAPDTIIDSGPANPTSSNAPTFTFHATEGSTFECSLDGSNFTTCASPASYAGLADGSHTFRVRAIDPAGNADATEASFTWTIDAPPPAPTLTGTPANPTNQTSASFSFTDPEAGVTFQCQRDGGAFSACTSPKAYTGLAQGSHTFGVKAQDAAGNQSGVTSFTWTIDTAAPPAPTLTGTRANPSNQTSASFSFSDTEAGVTFACRLDGSAFVACTSPQGYSGLAAGSHTFTVRAQDAAGNQSGNTNFTWTVDLTPPLPPTITASPAPSTTQTSASFTFSGQAGVTFLCQLDGSAFVACTSPQAYGGLAVGSHTFAVKAQEVSGNQSGAASFTWTVDQTPPAAPMLTGTPANPSNQTSASFSFSDTEAGVTFQCQRDGGAFSACTSPKAYTGLAQGGHTFGVKAQDAAGNQSGVTSFTWTIDTAAPPLPTLTGTPANPSNQTSASFSFSDTEAGVTFACRLDGSAFVACTSPQGYSGLAAGSHTFTVRAQDAAGNQSGNTNFTWTVDLTPPPAPTITASPAPSTTQTSASFTFSGQAGVTFLCQLDGSAFVACTSPQAYGGLAVGSHTFAVKAQEASGNQSGAASFTWTVDQTPPAAPMLTGTPANPSNQTSASFSFSDTEAGVTFQCQRDGGAFSACTSPKAYTGLAQGGHTFGVKAQDAAGNQSGVTSFTWTIDTATPPTPTLTGTPANPSNQTSASFSFTDTEAGVTFVCRLDGSAFAACTSPQGYSGLAAGSHTFTVRAQDAAGNQSGNTNFTWTVDLTPPPAPTITASPAPSTTQTSASFTFSGQAGVTFLCQLDGGTAASCTSPKSYTGLGLGTHTFSVRARDAAGNQSSPAPFTWTITP